MLSALAACLSLMADPIPPELDAYIKRPDPSFAWSKKSEGLASLHIRMTSQTWRNVRWTHDIVVTDPPVGTKRAANDGCVLYITGGEPNKADLNEAARLAELAHLPVALLFQIPNQPLFGMKEDDLIAHTFEEYLKEAMSTPGEPNPHLTDWPLLFPMTKSAVRAMDVLQAATRGSPHPLKRFVVTGASKRGWTTWLTGAIHDKRVVGIAPMVFDNLNFKPQLKRQLESWGKYSEMLGDYMDRGLDKIIDTPVGTHLIDMVDPYTYRGRIKVPKLIINGSNDRYWSVDSLSLYWHELRGPKYATIVPNAGHLLGDMQQALHAIAAFARSCLGEFAIPEFRTTISLEEMGQTYINIRLPEADVGQPPVQRFGGFWIAKSESRDFREAQWTRKEVPVIGRGRRATATLLIDDRSANVAVFGQIDYNLNGINFFLSDPIIVFPKR